MDTPLCRAHILLHFDVKSHFTFCHQLLSFPERSSLETPGTSTSLGVMQRMIEIVDNVFRFFEPDGEANPPDPVLGNLRFRRNCRMGHGSRVLDERADIAQAHRKGDAVRLPCQRIDEPLGAFERVLRARPFLTK